ncbi:MAG: HEAT repeat domain-containing protein [Candidatus Riflebacteria bacterium]|nr:HEAT repeat domain-containing protein [Candidatus Riflebacteria bacterium]
MGWLNSKPFDLTQSFLDMSSPDRKLASQAQKDIESTLDHNSVQFLCTKFEETDSLDLRLKILEILAHKRVSLSPADIKEIIKLLSYQDPLLREAFKEVFSEISEANLQPFVDVLCVTTDQGIRSVINYSIDRSGIIERLISKWTEYSSKDKLLYLNSIVQLQNPRLYPIFFDILKEETSEQKKEEKKPLQLEFMRHAEKIKDPIFMEQCVKNLPSIESGVWYGLLKLLRAHGDEFYKTLFDSFERKPMAFKHKLLMMLQQLLDLKSYPYLFSSLQDKAKGIPQLALDAICGIARNYCLEVEKRDKKSLQTEEFIKEIDAMVIPIERCFNDNLQHFIVPLAESLLRMGKFHFELILRNLSSLQKYAEMSLYTFIRALDVEDRKELLVAGCCHAKSDTCLTSMALLSNPTETFIIDVLNKLLLEKFLSLSPTLQNDILALMMDPRLKNMVDEALQHNDPNLRCRLLQVIGESGIGNAFTILKEKIHDPDTLVRSTIIELLRLPHYTEDQSIPVILEFLKDPDQNIVIKTIAIIRESDHPKVTGALSSLLGSYNSIIKDYARSAIAVITKRKYLRGFGKMTPESKLAVGLSLLKMDPGFMNEMAEKLSDPDGKARAMAAQVLEVLGDYLTPEVKTPLIVAIQDPDPYVRAIVIMGLGKIGGPAVANMLMNYINDPNDRVRANAVEALAFVGDLSMVDIILPFLRDRNNRVRANALMTLWKLGYYQIYQTIMEMFQDKNKWMRASVAFALGEIKDPRFITILLQNLKDADADVRRNIIKSLGKLSDPYSLAPYIRPLRFDPDEGVRKEINDILSLSVAARPTQ